MTKRKTLYALIATYVFLIICNFAFNQHLNSRLLFCLHVAALVVAIFICKNASLGLADLGMEKSNVKNGLKFSLYVIVPVACLYMFTFIHYDRSFMDPRYRESLPAGFVSAVILEPFKTILFEEIVFRGILLALLLRLNPNKWFAILVSSITFGFWHLLASQNFHQFRGAVTGSVYSGWILALGTIVFTTIAGIILCQLRFRSKSLVAPIAAHWFVNSFAIILAAISWSNV